MKTAVAVIMISFFAYVGLIVKLSDVHAKEKREAQIKDSISNLKLHK